LWPIDPHTAAKHGVLRAYLQRWIPIMSTQARTLAVIDGFAGPGQYRFGQPGSPIVMMEAFGEHSQRAEIAARTTIQYTFVEAMKDRCDHLVREVRKAEVALPHGWPRPVVIEGDFGAEVGPRVEALGRANVPIFLFIDPFGYTDPPPQLTTRLLSFSRCETLTFVPTNYIARFIDDEAQAHTFDNFFGRREWRDARMLSGAASLRHLVATFERRLHEDARWTRTFELVTGQGQLFHLFFATNNHRGLEKMKEAMWEIDPQGGQRFADSTNPEQAVMFSDTSDLRILERAVRARFRPGTWHRYSDLLAFTWDETAFLPRHLREDLERMRADRTAHALNLGPRGGFVDETLVEFLELS
jgi:three-Cys-motif partner protein